MDLRAWVSDGSRTVELLELVDQLPSSCRLNEAIAQDDAAADELLALVGDGEGDGKPWSPRVAEFDLTNTLLVSLINEVKILSQTVVASGGGKPKKVKPFPVPVTAIDRARERADLKMFRDFEAMFGFGK